MNKKLAGISLALAVATLSQPSYAQFGGLGKALGGGGLGKALGGGGGSSVSAESLVQSYVGGSQYVMNANAKLLKALNRKDEADRAELAAKNLTQTATASALEDTAKVQTDSSKALEEAMGANKTALSADSKKTYVAGVVDLVKGMKAYTGMAGDVKNFKPSMTSLGAASTAALYVVKSLPTSASNLKDTLARSIQFAKDNKIDLPADATSVL